MPAISVVITPERSRMAGTASREVSMPARMAAGMWAPVSMAVTAEVAIGQVIAGEVIEAPVEEIEDVPVIVEALAVELVPVTAEVHGVVIAVELEEAIAVAPVPVERVVVLIAEAPVAAQLAVVLTAEAPAAVQLVEAQPVEHAAVQLVAEHVEAQPVVEHVEAPAVVQHVAAVVVEQHAAAAV